MIIFVFAQLNAIPCIGEQDKRLDERITFENILFCILKQRAASYMQKQNITIGIRNYS